MKPAQRTVVIIVLVGIAVGAAVISVVVTESSLQRIAVLIIAVLAALAAVAEIVGLLDRVTIRRTLYLPDDRSEAVLEYQGCGDQPLDLGVQRLSVSGAFGSYFLGLLEREHSYVHIPTQIEFIGGRNHRLLSSIESLYDDISSARGSRILIIASQGGMGKSTLAARIVRCLFEQKIVTMLLGDSAKTEVVDVATGRVDQMQPGYYDEQTFLAKLRLQLGLPQAEVPIPTHRAIREISDRLIDRRTLIVLDNLETVKAGDKLWTTMRKLVSRDTWIIVTTRTLSNVSGSLPGTLMINLEPIVNKADLSLFLKWHVQQYSVVNPRLHVLLEDLEKDKRLEQLTRCTGGNPLLIQVVVGHVARLSWDYLDKLPVLYGDDLLNYLYLQSWTEFGEAGNAGLCARLLLRRIAEMQYSGKKVTTHVLQEWAQSSDQTANLLPALDLLYQSFLVVNSDPRRGSYSVVPSMYAFLERQQ